VHWRDRWRLGRDWVGIHAQGTLARILIAAMTSAVVGTWAMWWVGSHLGFVDLANVEVPDSTVLDGPLEVTLPAMLLMWPLGSALVIFVISLGDSLADRKRRRSQST